MQGANRHLENCVARGAVKLSLFLSLDAVSDIHLDGLTLSRNASTGTGNKAKHLIYQVQGSVLPEGCEETPPPDISPIGQALNEEPLAASRTTEITPALEKPFKEAKEEWLRTFETLYLTGLLERHGNNISHAARAAEIDRKYFRKLMIRYGISGGLWTKDRSQNV